MKTPSERRPQTATSKKGKEPQQRRAKQTKDSKHHAKRRKGAFEARDLPSSSADRPPNSVEAASLRFFAAKQQKHDAVQQETFEEEAELKRLEKKLKIKGDALGDSFAKDGLDFLLRPFDTKSDNEDFLSSASSSNEEYSREDCNEESQCSNDSNSHNNSIKDNFKSVKNSKTNNLEPNNSNVSKKCSIKTAEINAPHYSQAASKYVPPSMRNANAAAPDADHVTRITLNGLLNRLSDVNATRIAAEVAAVFEQPKGGGGRREVAAVLAQLIVERLATPAATLLEGFVAAAAAVCAQIHALRIGGDVFSAILEAIDAQINECLAHLPADPLTHAKPLANFCCWVAHANAFGAVGTAYVASLLEDVGRCLPLLEAHLDAVLRLLPLCAPLLKKEDAAQFGEVLRLFVVQPTDAPSSRAFFLKSAIAAFGGSGKKTPSTPAVVMTLRSGLQEAVKRQRALQPHFAPAEPLGVTRSDLAAAAAQNGRWWIVGGAWAGAAPPSAPKDASVASNSDAIASAAAAHHMNTAVRKDVFAAIMQAQDFADAFARILKLRLRNAQEREVCRVIVHCVSHEAAYNPFYALLSQRLCEVAFSHKITFQYALWDFLKESANVASAHVSASQLRKTVHMAKFFAFLVRVDVLSLAVLKVVPFEGLSSATAQLLAFLQVFFGVLFAPKTAEGVAVRIDIDAMVHKLESLPVLMNALVYFLSVHVLDAQNNAYFVRLANHRSILTLAQHFKEALIRRINAA